MLWIGVLAWDNLLIELPIKCETYVPCTLSTALHCSVPVQATQMVAVDNGDGTQQLAIPVMDPETGQETYMIIDPQTAQVGWQLWGHFHPWLLAEHRRR